MKIKRHLLLLLLVAIIASGCNMFRSWKSIPPPGGCSECHTTEISADWQVAYQPVMLSDETDRFSWQTPESMERPEESPLDQKKITEQRCFRCHKGPNKAHTEYKGRYHH